MEPGTRPHSRPAAQGLSAWGRSAPWKEVPSSPGRRGVNPLGSAPSAGCTAPATPRRQPRPRGPVPSRCRQPATSRSRGGPGPASTARGPHPSVPACATDPAPRPTGPLARARMPTVEGLLPRGPRWPLAQSSLQTPATSPERLSPESDHGTPPPKHAGKERTWPRERRPEPDADSRCPLRLTGATGNARQIHAAGGDGTPGGRSPVGAARRSAGVTPSLTPVPGAVPGHVAPEDTGPARRPAPRSPVPGRRSPGLEEPSESAPTATAPPLPPAEASRGQGSGSSPSLTRSPTWTDSRPHGPGARAEGHNAELQPTGHLAPRDPLSHGPRMLSEPQQHRVRPPHTSKEGSLGSLAEGDALMASGPLPGPGARNSTGVADNAQAPSRRCGGTGVAAPPLPARRPGTPAQQR